MGGVISFERKEMKTKNPHENLHSLQRLPWCLGQFLSITYAPGKLTVPVISKSSRNPSRRQGHSPALAYHRYSLDPNGRLQQPLILARLQV